MAIVIEEVLGPMPRGVLARLRHGDQQLEACVSLTPEAAGKEIGASLIVELDYSGVLSWRLVPPGDPAHARHGLFPAEPGRIQVVGEIHNVLQVEDGTRLYDVYLVIGPEFITFDSGSIDGPGLEVGVVIEAVVEGLMFYP